MSHVTAEHGRPAKILTAQACVFRLCREVVMDGLKLAHKCLPDQHVRNEAELRGTRASLALLRDL